MQTNLFSQATLSVQGIVKKSNGVALDDGEYSITFKIYATDGSPSGALWTEINPTVEVISGIYSVVLGSVTPLNLAFDQDYELGVTIGSQELVPRTALTSAPYALALRGSSNQFPSAGEVFADKVKVSQGVIVNTGAPTADIDGTKGYSFNNDNNTGVFSVNSGEVAIHSNGVDKFRVDGSGAVLNGPLSINNNAGINYQTTQGNFGGWRLADVDDLSGSTDGWHAYSTISGEQNGWNSPNVASPDASLLNGGSLVGNLLVADDNNDVLKKEYIITGLWSEMKVKFKYFFLDNWDHITTPDIAFAGIAPNVNGNPFRVGWNHSPITNQSHFELNSTAFLNATDIENNSGGYADFSINVEMTARRNGSNTNFWVFIGAALNDGKNEEGYAVGPIEVWVR